MRAKNALLSGLSTLLLLFSLALPQTGLAQQPVAERAAPRIEGFDVVPARRLSAGSELAFTLYGTAGGTASVRIGNMTKRILLDEVETGVYEGSYTIKTSDRIAAATTTTANLRVGNQIATGMLNESLLAGARSPATRADALPGAPSAPRIDRFEVELMVGTLSAIEKDAQQLAGRLTKALEDKEWEVRRVAGVALGKLGPEAKNAVPKLFRLLSSDEDRDFASSALKEINTAPVEAIPLLLEKLESEERRTAFYAVSLLGKIGPPAAEALPKLEAMLAKPSEDKGRSEFRRKFLVEAIAAIKGEPKAEK